MACLTEYMVYQQDGELFKSTDHLNNLEKDIVRAFFSRLRSIYGASVYDKFIGTNPGDQRMVAAEWCDRIVQYTPERLALILDMAARNKDRSPFIDLTKLLAIRLVGPMNNPLYLRAGLSQTAVDRQIDHLNDEYGFEEENVTDWYGNHVQGVTYLKERKRLEAPE